MQASTTFYRWSFVCAAIISGAVCVVAQTVSGDSVVRTLASGGLIPPTPSSIGFLLPNSVVVSSNGRIAYISDPGNFIIRKMDTVTSTVTILAGALNGNGCSDGDALTATSFTSTRSLALDNRGNLYIADTGCHSIRAMDLSTNMVTTLAGPASAATVTCSENTDGPGVNALFANPSGLATDNAGNVYVSDADCNEIRVINVATQVVSTLAGQWWSSGSSNGIGTAATFTVPNGLAFDGVNTLYVADTQNNLIRNISLSTARVGTLAGAPSPAATGFTNGIGAAARFKFPNSVAFHAPRSLFVADAGGTSSAPSMCRRRP